MSYYNNCNISNSNIAVHDDIEEEDAENDDFLDYLVQWCQLIPKNNMRRRQLMNSWEMENLMRAHKHLAFFTQQITDSTHGKTTTTTKTNTIHDESYKDVSCSDSCLENSHIWFRIAEFLTATNLVHLSRTNNCFRNLVHQHAQYRIRTEEITTTTSTSPADIRIRQQQQQQQPSSMVSSILEHVRAMEIVQGNLEYDNHNNEQESRFDSNDDNIGDEDSHRHPLQRPKNLVPIRIPLPMQKIIVTDAGDTEYNGIYCCTSLDGNGFVFTKPRCPPSRRQPRSTHHSRVLLCILSKRFSNENLLWYMSKEVWTDQQHEQDQGGIHRDDGTTEVFSFWSMLMVEPNHTHQHSNTTTTTSWTEYPYSSFPTQTSRSPMITGGWHNLPTTAHFHPPTVELWEDETL